MLTCDSVIIWPQVNSPNKHPKLQHAKVETSDNLMVRLGLIQMCCTNNPDKNLKKGIAHIRQAVSQGAQIVCLQELFHSHYFCQKEDTRFFDLAEPVPGPTTKILSQLASELQIIIIAPLFEKRTAGIYHNTAVVIDHTGNLLGKYRKMHVPDDPFYYEKFYFTPGDLGFQSFSTIHGEIGSLICCYQWLSDSARITELDGSQLLFYPTAIGWQQGESEENNRSQLKAWETIQQGHAIANGVFLVAVNRVGQEGKLNFWGSSFVCDPSGKVLDKASTDNEEILIVDCDLGAIEATRRSWPFLRDRRIESYQGLSLRFGHSETKNE